eukprot:TRINITY_DN14401_c0_g1_i1.p1 TRINITY_DN14401_c0_g1~~TRINITY_DN14401_c0_g1_i1.p1  ORF type:complete len:558 (+),score=137.18 TRINITY_DN14401_c0_g1_i1:87-1760(+)
MATPSQAELDFKSEQYLREKKVPQIINELVAELVQTKPDDALGYMSELIPKMKEAEANSGQKKKVEECCPAEVSARPLAIIVLGASGDLAKKKTFPALFKLFAEGLVPAKTAIVGYARTAMTHAEFCEKLKPTLPKDWDPNVYEKFFLQCHYVQGSYDKQEDFKKLNKSLEEIEAPHKRGGNRLFYLALPPSVFLAACSGIKQTCMTTPPCWVRVIIEKPFGRDTETSAKLTADLAPLFSEDQIYRIDHYLGKEMVQNLITLRFANKLFSHIWDKSAISNVQITFKETIGTMGRGGYFDTSGIIRDVLQNHLLQVMALITMEKPKNLTPESVRDEKVAVLTHVRPATAEDAVLGQYTKSLDGSEPGYLDDPTVPEGSNTPTFAQTILWVDNDRWDGVPFILKAAKAVERKEVSIRIQFKPELRPYGDTVNRNELVVRLQPNEAMYLKINAKDPGMTNEIHTTELDLTYSNRYGVALPDAYESLIYEAVQGNATNFVRSDELDAAWRIYTPLLKQIEAGSVKSVPYAFGTRGPPEADERKYKLYSRGINNYTWHGPQK